MLKVLMVASEGTPYVKTGGLADVIGSLPSALVAQGVDVRVIMPRYSNVEFGERSVVSLGLVRVPFDGSERLAEIQQAVPPTGIEKADDITAYFVEAPQFFRRPLLYGYEDDLLRYGFFSRAVLEMLRQLTSLHWCPDIIHCHDWHTGLLPVYLRTVFKDHELLSAIKTVFSIHNLAYQGVVPKSYLPRLGLSWDTFNFHQLEYFDQVNPMKGGLVFSDELTAVSAGYASEIQTPEYGEGLDHVLRERADHLTGIINGIDYTIWHPSTDPFICANYSALDWSNKAACKRDLLQTVGLLPVEDDAADWEEKPIVGIVSRLSSQKGFDLVIESMEKILELGCYFVLLGNGDERYLHLFEDLGRRYPKTTSMNLGKFNEELAHKIYAGSDLFLMPSRYEPCGLGQMIALDYGTVPIVRCTGGLADTVHHWEPKTRTGNGFVFQNFSAYEMMMAVQQAIEAYHSRAWPEVVRNAFAGDFSWDASAARYKKLYENLARETKMHRVPQPSKKYA